MGYRLAFPDFGDLDVALPEGFADASVDFEISPSFENRELGLRLYVGHADPARRDPVHGNGRFCVARLVDGRTLLQTDDWSLVTDLIAESKPSNLLPFRR